MGQGDAFSLAERVLYAIGAGYTILVCGTLFVSYLPGGLSQVELLVIFDGLSVVFFGLCWRMPHPPTPSPDSKSQIRRGGDKSNPVAGGGLGESVAGWRIFPGHRFGVLGVAE